MSPDRTIVTFAIALIASLSLALPAACNSDAGTNADGGGGASGSAGTGGSGVDAAIPDTGTGACAGLHCGELCNSCPPNAPLCPGAIAYCDSNGACVIGSPPVCP